MTHRNFCRNFLSNGSDLDTYLEQILEDCMDFLTLPQLVPHPFVLTYDVVLKLLWTYILLIGDFQIQSKIDSDPILIKDKINFKFVTKLNDVNNKSWWFITKNQVFYLWQFLWLNTKDGTFCSTPVQISSTGMHHWTSIGAHTPGSMNSFGVRSLENLGWKIQNCLYKL